MKTALLFGGQGERNLHVALRQGLERGSPLLERALRASNCTADRLLNDGGRALELSHVLQPMIVALSLMDAIRLENQGLVADYLAGHSLGELAAWAFAGAMTLEDAVEIAAVRGRAMGRAARAHEGGMLALTDIDEARLQRMLAIGGAKGRLEVAAYNAPREVVLTGTLPALQAVAPLCQSRRLNVSGPWHSPLMEEAKPEFATALETLPIGQNIRPVVSGHDGVCLKDAREMAPRLLAQLTEPLRWTAVLATLVSLGVERFVVAGPGRAMRYLVHRNLPWAEVRTT
ncbi:ACP S-malonyltransferase [candidate division KSB1 bacterium]|nr:ACP S-malonyltransferase [candidate division KSB1 bacterium]